MAGIWALAAAVADSRQDAQVRFGANVERLRQRGGWSLEELAARAQVDPEEVAAVLRGDEEPHFVTILLLAGALGVEPGDLLAGAAWVPDGEGGGEYRVEDPDGD